MRKVIKAHNVGFVNESVKENKIVEEMDEGHADPVTLVKSISNQNEVAFLDAIIEGIIYNENEDYRSPEEALKIINRIKFILDGKLGRRGVQD